jgi:hypothetical protein
MTPLGVTLTARDRRALALGTLVIGGLLIGGRGIPAWRRWEQTAFARADAAAVELAHQQAALVDQRAAHDSLIVRRKRLEALRSTWLDGDTPAAAGAALASVISSAGERAGVTIGALDIRVDSASVEPFVPIYVHATTTGDIQGIASLLAALEGGRLAIAIRAFSVDAADPAAPPNRAEVLRADLTVEGPWHKEPLEVSR